MSMIILIGMAVLIALLPIALIDASGGDLSPLWVIVIILLILGFSL